MSEKPNATLEGLRHPDNFIPITRWRKKPVVIRAFQTTREFKIQTLEGEHTASVGDYVIEGVNKELYPCKPEIFHKTYEEVTE